MTLTHGSLFTGYGGLDLAVNAVFGSETLWVSDIDKGALKVMGHRFPGVPNLGDITTVNWSDVPPVDILSGGSPCQDLSHAGRRGGMRRGNRSNLWVSMREGIAQLRPEWIVWENVRGAYSAAADSEVEPCPGCVGDGSNVSLRALGRVLGDLSELGYMGGWYGLRAADIGAPHERFRVFVVARLAAADTQCGRLDGRAFDAVGRAVRGVASPRGREVAGALALLPTPAVNDMGEGKTVEAWDAWTDRMKSKHGNGNGHGNSLAIEAQRLLPTPTTQDQGASGSAGYPTTAKHNPGTTLTDAAVRQPELWGRYAAAVVQWERVSGRPAPRPTEPGRAGVPRLSPTFTEWMMGLPAGWITDVPGVTRQEALQLCGNGVVPQQGAAAIRAAFDALAEWL